LKVSLRKQLSALLAGLFLLSALSMPAMAETASAETDTAEYPPYLTPYADLEAASFKVGQGISYYLTDYVQAMRAQDLPNRLTVRCVTYTDIPGASDSTKALSCTLSTGTTGEMFGVRFGGGSKVGTFDSFSEKGNVAKSALKDSGLAFYIDLTKYPETLSLQVTLTESDCTTGGAFTGRPTSYRLNDQYYGVDAIQTGVGKCELPASNQHILIPANFKGWIMIPFAEMQRVRFNSYDVNGSFDLKNIESVMFLFPTGQEGGSFCIDQISFYGPYFKQYSEKTKPAEDSSLAELVERSDEAEPYIINEEDIEAEPTIFEPRIPFAERYPILLLVLLILGGLFLLDIFAEAIWRDLMRKPTPLIPWKKILLWLKDKLIWLFGLVKKALKAKGEKKEKPDIEADQSLENTEN